MKSWLGLATMVLLGACSGGDPSPNQTEAEDAVQAQETVAPGISQSGKMTGDISALTGDVSGLNIRVTDMGTVIDLPADTLFEYDKADLTKEAEDQLRKAADVIRQSPETGAITVTGHTDSHGGDAYNMDLSERRAKTVADWFSQQVGVRKREFRVSGKGESEPAVSNTTPDGKDDPTGRAKNRRVEVMIPSAN